MFRVLIFIGMILTLSSCNETFYGKLNVSKDILHISKDGTMVQTIPVGEHTTQLSFSRKKATIKITAPEKISFKFKIPKEVRDQARDGIIDIKAEQSGLGYDLKGSVSYDEEYSRRLTEHQPCNIPGQPRTGYKYIEYRYVYIDAKLDFSVINQDQVQHGDFSGGYQQRVKEILYEGICN